MKVTKRRKHLIHLVGVVLILSAGALFAYTAFLHMLDDAPVPGLGEPMVVPFWQRWSVLGSLAFILFGAGLAFLWSILEPDPSAA